MEEGDSPAGAVRSTGPDRRKQGGVEDSGSCNGVSPGTELYETGSNQAAGRSDHNGPGCRGATGIRVLKVRTLACHAYMVSVGKIPYTVVNRVIVGHYKRRAEVAYVILRKA